MTQSRLLYSATMSLDGFIAGPGGDMSWLSTFATDNDDESEALHERIGALLIGSRTFGGDDPNRGTDSEGAFGGRWEGMSFVLTHDRAGREDTADTVFLDDLETAVARAREAAGGKHVCILGANVARQCLDAGLLDEVLVFIAPVLLGDGTRLLDHPGGTNVRLTPRETAPFRLWFDVERS